MSRGAEYLEYVTDKLKKCIRQINGMIQDVQKDIENMNEYYWQNYAEMDEYGYEVYDNQQALLQQMKAKQDSQMMKQRLKKMIDSPFFGSLAFCYDGDEEAEYFYIGISNFAEERGNVPLIYDWRAPVSGLFYDYDKGKAAYEAPAGLLTGEILSKWQYKIRDGKMQYEFESDVKIDDDILKQELGSSSDTKLKKIVCTIQREQNAIIRNTKDKILVIQGVAGSGKTSVALHRIAYLLYHDREHLKSSNILILSPNGVFADYISHILPELGEENIQEMSFDLFAYRELKGIAGDCEDRYHQIERKLYRESDDARYKWKQSAEYISAVEGFLVGLEDRLLEFCDIKWRKYGKTAEELLKLFYEKFSGIPLLSRMDTVMEYFIDEYETLQNWSLQEEERELIEEQFMSMYVTRDIYEIYNWFLSEYDFPELPHVEREKRVVPYEDVFPLLYLKYRLCADRPVRGIIRHLVIDEMQDYSYLQYVILERLFPCSMTILGDREQTVDDEEQDVLSFLPKIFGKKIRKIEMKKSYRNTAPIAAYAGKIGGIKGVEYIDRAGKEVVQVCASSVEEVVQDILEKVHVGRDSYETAAVITMTESGSKKIFSRLKGKRKDVNYVDRDSKAFRRGITVTTYYLAKGLEFDQVFLVGGDAENPLFKNFRYIGATRALHELYVYDIPIRDRKETL